ncbi:hypothetical protein ACL02T_11920 [Pseudonocardia sp. RS010]|uniref:hypothetical protein n=1 Tax=Pseudonocardia sp. RS010 TaxID=3385979 RepID=UPI0039A3EAB7
MADAFEKHLVVAFFEPAAANLAVDLLEAGLGADATRCSVGLLAQDDHGRVVAATLGPRVVGSTAAVGAVLGVIALAVTGGEVPDPAHVLDEGSALSADDIARIGAELDAGAAAVAVLGDSWVAGSAVVELTRLGGKTEMHGMTRAGLDYVLSAPSFVA